MPRAMEMKISLYVYHLMDIFTAHTDSVQMPLYKDFLISESFKLNWFQISTVLLNSSLFWGIFPNVTHFWIFEWHLCVKVMIRGGYFYCMVSQLKHSSWCKFYIDLSPTIISKPVALLVQWYMVWKWCCRVYPTQSAKVMLVSTPNNSNIDVIVVWCACPPNDIDVDFCTDCTGNNLVILWVG